MGTFAVHAGTSQVDWQPAGTYDLILVGTGFASSFFLHRYLALAGPTARVLALERGERHDHRWHLTHQDELTASANGSFVNRTPDKPWVFKLAFGGGSNCWWACTPRLLPEDFRLGSLYGHGRDWPITYDEIEDDYCQVEEIMGISGPSDASPYPRSRPYPLPPHRFSNPDRLLKQRFPDRFFNQPTARASIPTGGRSRCCASGTCSTCPVDATFTIPNGLKHLYEDDRVTLVTEAAVGSVDVTGSVARAVRFTRNGREMAAHGEVIGLGANAIFNPFLLLRSGLQGPSVGRGLVEQASVEVDVFLDGVDNFQGSTSITGLGYMLYDGPRRARRAAALMESWNVPELRDERGRWRQRLFLKFIFEDLPRDENRVEVDAADPAKPAVTFVGRSEYTERGLAALQSDMQQVLAALPTTRYRMRTTGAGSTEAHILCTTPMGTDPAVSVVDRTLVHHRVRNLLVLGGSVFPTASPANPTLTISALSMWAAARLLRQGHQP